jgi:hypothetical protein
MFLCIFFLTFVNPTGCIPKKYLITDPVEAHERAWSRFDFTMDNDYNTDHFTWFLLRTPQYVETYYRLLGRKQPVDTKTVQREIKAAEKHLVVEVNLEAMNQKDLDLDKWKFRLYDDKRHKYKPIAVDVSEIMRGEEYIRSFNTYQPVILKKKSGNVTVESITPTFYTPNTETAWLRTLVLYFPVFRKGSTTPIVNENVGEIKLEAKLKRTVSSHTLSVRWNAGELVRNPDMWREYYKAP